MFCLNAFRVWATTSPFVAYDGQNQAKIVYDEVFCRSSPMTRPQCPSSAGRQTRLRGRPASLAIDLAAVARCCEDVRWNYSNLRSSNRNIYYMAALSVILEILSPMSLRSREEGRIVLDLWRTHLPDLLPDKYGRWEPIDRPFDRCNFEDVLNDWQWPFLSVRKKPAVDASIWIRKGAKQQLHSTLIFRLEPGAATDAKLLDFVKATSVEIKVDFACLHVLTVSEIERGRKYRTVTPLDRPAAKFSFLLASKDLPQRIPDLYWTTVFGVPYVEMFGEEKLLSAPVRLSERLSNGSVLLQLSEDLGDVEQRSDEIERIRSTVKAHLGLDAFSQPGLEASHSYRVPQFSFENP